MDRMSFDAILTHVGDFGAYQKRIVILVIIITWPMAFQTLLPVFTLGRPQFRCAVPGLENDTFNIQNDAHAAFVNDSIPYDEDKGGYSECYAFTVTIVTGNESADYDWSAQNRSLQSCTSWVYSKDTFHSSLVTELDLVCDRQIYVSHANMMTMAGFTIGSLIGGLTSDILGRKKALMIYYSLHFITGLALAFATSIPVLLVLRCFNSAAGMSYYIGAFTLCAEVVGPRKRSLTTMLILEGWPVGLVILGGVAYFIRDWQTLHLVLSVPPIVLFIACWFVPESPRWLLFKKRYEEARNVLLQISRVNHTSLPEDMSLEPLATETTEHCNEVKESTSISGGVLLIFKSSTMMLRVLILAYNWAVCNMVYYGLLLNVGALVKGNIYLNYILMSLQELFAYAVSIYLLDRIGRKRLYSFAILLAGLACLSTMVPLLTDTDEDWINPLLANVGKFGVTIAFAILWLFTAELFPIIVRNSGLGACSLAARIGGFVSPYIGNLHYLVSGGMGQSLPLIIFGGTALLAGLLALLLPETCNKELPDTVEDAENLNGKKGKVKESGSELDCEKVTSPVISTEASENVPI